MYTSPEVVAYRRRYMQGLLARQANHTRTLTIHADSWIIGLGAFLTHAVTTCVYANETGREFHIDQRYLQYGSTYSFLERFLYTEDVDLAFGEQFGDRFHHSSREYVGEIAYNQTSRVIYETADEAQHLLEWPFNHRMAVAVGYDFNDVFKLKYPLVE